MTATKEKPVPCIFIAPAGTPLFVGNALGKADHPEHLPYARAGFAVIAYEISGDLAEGATNSQARDAIREFRAADAGIYNASAAIDYAIKALPMIDPAHLAVAGHSSAGTLALLVAEHDRRIKACIAYAPCTDVPGRLEKPMPMLEQMSPGIEDFLREHSPNTGADKLHCRLFLFHSEEDANVLISQSADFVAEVRRTNPDVTFVRAPTGDHYHSMIDQGIPAAIQWLKGE